MDVPLKTTFGGDDRGNSIELRGVEKRYGPSVALQPIDLDILDGEFFCLLGPSGCGKTTTLNIIGGFLEPTAGTVRIAGVDVTKIPPNRRPVNTVFQSYALFPHLDVVDNVSFGLRMARVEKRERYKRASEALELVGLGAFSKRQVGELSGGQAQRVAIARALVNKPKVLLLDEPLGALDLKLRKRLQTELALIQRHVGTTFVFVTHDQEEAMTLADRILILNEGRIEQVGTPEEIYRRPASLFAADFIGESNILRGTRDGDTFVLENAARVPISTRAPGDVSSLLIRPEAMRIGRDGFIDAQVLSRGYLGSTTRIVLQLENSEIQVVSSLNDGDLHDLAEIGLETGDFVKLSWPTEAAHPMVETHEESGSRYARNL
ncbi:ABC transporter ATP-binding protein [Mycobacterium antarcticum]|nr:ABC transporter ATP-binding protein [Mycolicibacterium sp. TUM20985]